MDTEKDVDTKAETDTGKDTNVGVDGGSANRTSLSPKENLTGCDLKRRLFLSLPLSLRRVPNATF